MRKNSKTIDAPLDGGVVGTHNAIENGGIVGTHNGNSGKLSSVRPQNYFLFLFFQMSKLFTLYSGLSNPDVYQPTILFGRDRVSI